MKKIIAVMIVVFVVVFSCLFMIIPKKNYSENENRYFAKISKISFKKILSCEFQNSVTDYISDHFPFRDFLLGEKNKLYHNMGMYRINDVYYTKDNHLIEEFTRPKSKESITRIVNKFVLNNSGKKIDFILSPTNLYLYGDEISKYNLNYSEDKVIDYYKNNLNLNFIDVRDILMDNKDEYIFYNSDHHWTTLGAYYVYDEYCRKNNINKAEFKFKKVSDNFKGSLYSKVLDNSIKKDYIIRVDNDDNYNYNVIIDGKMVNDFYDASFLEKKDKYSYFFGGNKGVISIENMSIDNSDNILIIKDSYANSFIPFISSNYRNVYVIDPRYYYESIKSFIEKNNIDNILFMYNVLTIDDDLGIVSING